MRKSTLIFCTSVLAICGWLILRETHRQAQTNLPKIQPTITNQPNTSKEQQNKKTTAPKSIPQSQQSHLDFLTRLGIDTNSKIPIVQQLSQNPINFYGKVIDENSNPIVGANVEFGWDDMTAKNWTRTSTTETDAGGLFSLHDKIGATLTVSVSKEGYYTPSNGQGAYHYVHGSPNFSPDSNNPVVFFLRRKGIGANLIQKEFPPIFTRIWQLHHDGTPIELDLLNGSQNVTGSGQLKLEFWRDISDLKRRPFDWKLQISVLGGGITPTDQEFAFEAPENGYQPSVIVDMPATNENWIGELRSKYYIQLPNGDYGRFDFYLLSRNGVFTIKSWVNPTGSRNLEPK